jgi:hypothetical protein
MANITINGIRQNEKVFTLSEPVLPVEAGEAIGYTSSPSNEANYIHWEVFSSEADLFGKVLNACDDKNILKFVNISCEAEDGVFSVDEINKLFRSNVQELFFGQYWAGGVKNFEDILKDYYYSNPKVYTRKISVKTNNRNLINRNWEALLVAKSKGTVLKCIISNELFNKITVLPQPHTVRDNPCRLDMRKLIHPGYTLEMGLNVDSLQIIPSAEINYTLDCGNQKELFKEYAGKADMLRNALFSSVSPWTEHYWDLTVKRMKESRRIRADYTFDRADFAEYLLFDVKNEYALFDPIFSGNKTFINPANKMTYIHPVTFLWMLSLNTNANIWFVVPDAQSRDS